MKRILLTSALGLLAFAMPCPAADVPATKPKETTTKPAADPKKPSTEPKETTKPAADKAPEKAKDGTEKPKSEASAKPFYGAVAAVDAAKQTVTVGKNVYHATKDTEIHNDGAPATFADIQVGKKIGGSYTEVKGKRTLVKLNTGVKQEPEPAKEEPSKAKEEPKKETPAKPKTKKNP